MKVSLMILLVVFVTFGMSTQPLCRQVSPPDGIHCQVRTHDSTSLLQTGDSSVPTNHPQPIMLSRLPYNLGPIKQALFSGWDDYENLQINTDSTTWLQNEEQVAINPLATNHLVAVWRDFRFGYRRIGWGISSDSGRTWNDQVLPQYFYPWQSDPAITYNRNGDFYVIMVTFDEAGEDGLFVVTSEDNGVTWTDSTFVVNAYPDRFEDKELIACDRTASPGSGNLYVSWTPFYGEPNTDSTHIMVACSYDSAESFREPVIISDDIWVQWSVPAVGADGEVYVAWINYYGFIKMDHSFDYGHTWGQDINVQPINFISGEINGNLMTFSFPAMDVDIFNTPWRGRIYMTYADYSHSGNDLDIYLTISDDDGESWTTPRRLNDDLPGPIIDQFHPWVCVDTSGVVTVVFYDRRHDQNNLLMDLYFTQSTDGGNTWSPNARITTVSSDPTAGSRAGLIGEYVGLASYDGLPHAVWTDTRNGNQDVFTARLDSVPGSIAITHNKPPIPSEINLGSYPNPFNPATVLTYTLTEPSQVSLVIYDITGREVVTLLNGWYSAGEHRQLWNASNLSSGIYFARLSVGNLTRIQKLLLIK